MQHLAALVCSWRRALQHRHRLTMQPSVKYAGVSHGYGSGSLLKAVPSTLLKRKDGVILLCYYTLSHSPFILLPLERLQTPPK
jgi:hypothetical protein